MVNMSSNERINIANHALTSLVGEEITSVAISPWSIEIHTHTAGLRVEGSWRLHDAQGRITDQSVPYESRQDFQLWRLAGNRIVSFDLVPTELLTATLVTDLGWKVLLFGDCDGLEDWQLTAFDHSFDIVCNGRV